jgi:hypothetical protein
LIIRFREGAPVRAGSFTKDCDFLDIPNSL